MTHTRTKKRCLQLQIQINLFGGLEVLADGKPVLEQLRQSRKTDLFLEYLILRRGRPVPHEELLGALWSDRESRNPATALRTLLHRYRRIVQTEGLDPLEHSVLTMRGYYQWNAEMERCTVDVYVFEKLAQEARTLPAGDERRMPLYRRMIALYRGPLLLTAAQSWIVPRSAYYHDLYVECVYGLIDLLKAREAFDEIVTLCRQVAEVAQFDGRLQAELMLALARTDAGAQPAANGADALPQEALCTAYDTVLRAEHSVQMGMEALQLTLDQSGSGAYACDFPVFQGIYQLQRKLAEHATTAVLLCLLTLTGPDGEQQGEAFETEMQRLYDVAVATLRRGDVLSRYGTAEIAALLPVGSYEAGRQTVERVRRAFYREDMPGYVVTYRLRPLQE